MKKKILVTGGAGFLGSYLCERLLNDGQSVICVDNLSTGTKKNIGHLVNNASFGFLFHDITSPLDVEVNEIYNFACPASPVKYQHDPIQTTKTAVLGSLNMLDLAKRTNAKILLASTSEVYGDPSVHPQTEDYWGNVNPIGPRSCYDEGKRCAETLYFDYNRKHNLKINVARIFNTYGPRMHPNDGRVVSNFIVQALQNRDITIYGNGSHNRSFCYVDDLIEGIILFMDSPDKFIGPVNLGNPNAITIKELAKKIIRMLNYSGQLTFEALPENDPVSRQPDITLAKTVLDWHPTIQLDSGLKATIDYFKDVIAKMDIKPNIENKEQYKKNAITELV